MRRALISFKHLVLYVYTSPASIFNGIWVCLNRYNADIFHEKCFEMYCLDFNDAKGVKKAWSKQQPLRKL